MTYSKDISNKIDTAIARALVDLSEITTAREIPFFVIGATARDIVFGAIHNVPTTRATLDIDLGICVNTWVEYEQVINDLVSIKSYRRDSKQLQRVSNSVTLVDIVPFGPLESPVGSIAWPPRFDIAMKTAGFIEALQSAIDVKISSNPDVVVKVSSPAALAVMKLCAWKDDYPRRKRDAIDLRYLLINYINAGNESRLYTTDDDLRTEDLDYDYISARLLGRDACAVCSPKTLATVVNILSIELAEESSLFLITDMLSERMNDEFPAEFILQLLQQFKLGLEEVRTRKD